MSGGNYQYDLVILAPCKNIEFAAKGILTRFQSLKIRAITYDLFVHPERDPGCFRRAHDFLRPFARKYAHALVIFDYAGCGKKGAAATDLEVDLEQRLSASGWDDRAAAVIIEPELEIWVWSKSSNVDLVLGWADRDPDLRTWMLENDYIQDRFAKPAQPKEVLEQALSSVGKPRSSALFLKLAQLVSLENCTDQSFLKLKTLLQDWFPETVCITNLTGSPAPLPPPLAAFAPRLANHRPWREKPPSRCTSPRP